MHAAAMILAWNPKISSRGFERRNYSGGYGSQQRDV